jgi:hypothetical protein
MEYEREREKHKVHFLLVKSSSPQLKNKYIFIQYIFVTSDQCWLPDIFYAWNKLLDVKLRNIFY